MRYLFIILIFFSCTKDIEPEVEEAQSAIRGRKLVATTSIQSAIDRMTKGTVIIKQTFFENVITKTGVNIFFDGGKIIGSVVNRGDVSITGEGSIEGTATYTEAVSNYGNLILECTISSNGSCIVNYSGELKYKGTGRSVIDYTIRNSGGRVFINNSNLTSKYNAAIGQYGGISDSVFINDTYTQSERWNALEQGGGYIKGVNSTFKTLHLDPVEGTAFWPYGGELAEFSNCTFTCTAPTAKSIDNEGSLHGLVRLLSTCYANRHVADGLNIENKNLLIIQ